MEKKKKRTDSMDTCSVSQILVVFATCAFLLLFYLTASSPGTHKKCARHNYRPRSGMRDAYREFFTDETKNDTQENEPEPDAAAEAGEDVAVDQAAIDASDILLPDEQRAAIEATRANAKQVQTVNDRFEAAKRKVSENRLRPGMGNYQQRRKLIETLLRRPQCTRRIRSWRQENSDVLRGDVVPKTTTNSWGLMRMGRTNPSVDLHPGAMGTMAGLQGRWLSEEGVPDNAIPDDDSFVY